MDPRGRETTEIRVRERSGQCDKIQGAEGGKEATKASEMANKVGKIF